jgi:hypothetical protein
MKNVKVLAYLRADQKKALDQRSKEIGIPIAEQIRRAVDLYLKASK